MSIQEAIAKLNLGELSISQIPQIAFEEVMSGIESESLLILAGMSESDNSFEIKYYLDNTIDELDIKSYFGLEAAFILANYYVNPHVSKTIKMTW